MTVYGPLGTDVPPEVTAAYDLLVRYAQQESPRLAVNWSRQMTRRLEEGLAEWGRRGTNTR